MRSHDRADQVESRVNIGCPVTHRLVDRIFQSCSAVVHAVDLCTQQFHTVYVQPLTANVLFAHIDLAFHIKHCTSSCSCHAVLSGTGFGNDPLLAHFLCQQDLSQHVVDLVCTGVVQVFPLQVDLAAAQISGHAVCIVQH